jgi:hypothetical protein
MEQQPSTTPQPVFPLGFVVATPGARDAFQANNAVFAYYLAKHQCGQWGNLSTEDMRANEQALRHGLRLLSAYHSQRHHCPPGAPSPSALGRDYARAPAAACLALLGGTFATARRE